MLEFLKSVVNGKVDSTSKPGELNRVDVVKALREMLVVAAASAVAFLVQTLPTMDFGNWDALKLSLLIPALSWCGNLLLRYRKDNTVSVDPTKV